MDYFGIQDKRSLAKQELHSALKELSGIQSLTELTAEQLQLFILQIHVVFADMGITLNKAGERKDIRKLSMKKLLKLTNDKFKEQGKQLREEDKTKTA